MSRNDISAIVAEFSGGRAAYGVVELPLGIPMPYQGKKQLFDVAASISYPDGRGELLRSHVGDELSSAGAPRLGKVVSSALEVAVTGVPSLSLVRPSRVKLMLPVGVEENVEGLNSEHREEWTLPNDFGVEKAG